MTEEQAALAAFLASAGMAPGMMGPGGAQSSAKRGSKQSGLSSKQRYAVAMSTFAVAVGFMKYAVDIIYGK